MAAPGWPTSALIEAQAAWMAAVEASIIRIEEKLDHLLALNGPVVVFDVGSPADKELQPTIVFHVGTPIDKEI